MQFPLGLQAQDGGQCAVPLPERVTFETTRKRADGSPPGRLASAQRKNSFTYRSIAQLRDVLAVRTGI